MLTAGTFVTLNDLMNNAVISKIYFPQCLFFAKIILM